ncbi:MAG TPA: hypothetical protein VGE29_12520, partial [Prosthecobacter sp.]
ESGQDMGRHLHGPDGQKYFPSCNKIMDKNGNVSSAGNKFGKQFKKAVNNQISSPNIRAKINGVGVLGVLFLVASVNADEEAGRSLGNALEMYEISRRSGSDIDCSSAITDAGKAASEMFGPTFGLWVVNKLEEGR